MAINYLNSIDLNRNELQDAQLIRSQVENQPNDAAVGGTPVEGQLYFNTSDDVLKIYANGAWVEVGGGVETLTTTDGTYINLAPNSPTSGAVTVTADLSAIDGTSSAGERYLTKTNVWAEISTIPGTYVWDIQGDTGGPTSVTSGSTIDFEGGNNVTTALVGNTLTINSTNEAVTLTGDVTGTGATSIATTISAGAVDFAMINPAVVITEAEGIVNNDNDVTLPTSAAVKAYVDDSVAGGLVYQGGYNAATNTPNLDSPPTGAVNKGFTYTVTADGLFFTEQVRVGDVLIAEIDTPTTLADWTTVQNNIDLADLTTVGIGNVNAGTGISVAYSNGTATVTNTQTNSDNTYAVTITDTATITHGLGTKDVIIQLYDVTTDETVYADVDRASTTTATITFATTPTNSVRVLVQKIG